LVAALGNANGWHRDTAARLLFERQDKSAVAPLRELTSKAMLPQSRMHALYALSGLGALRADDLIPRLADREARVREHAVRLSEKVAGGSTALRDALVRLVDDEDALVRYQLAFSLGEFDDPRKATALAALLARDGSDRWARLAVFSSLAKGAGDVFSLLAK